MEIVLSKQVPETDALQALTPLLNKSLSSAKLPKLPQEVYEDDNNYSVCLSMYDDGYLLATMKVSCDKVKFFRHINEPGAYALVDVEYSDSEFEEISFGKNKFTTVYELYQELDKRYKSSLG